MQFFFEFAISNRSQQNDAPPFAPKIVRVAETIKSDEQALRDPPVPQAPKVEKISKLPALPGGMSINESKWAKEYSDPNYGTSRGISRAGMGGGKILAERFDNLRNGSPVSPGLGQGSVWNDDGGETAGPNGGSDRMHTNAEREKPYIVQPTAEKNEPSNRPPFPSPAVLPDSQHSPSQSTKASSVASSLTGALPELRSSTLPAGASARRKPKSKTLVINDSSGGRSPEAENPVWVIERKGGGQESGEKTESPVSSGNGPNQCWTNYQFRGRGGSQTRGNRQSRPKGGISSNSYDSTSLVDFAAHRDRKEAGGNCGLTNPPIIRSSHDSRNANENLSSTVNDNNLHHINPGGSHAYNKRSAYGGYQREYQEDSNAGTGDGGAASWSQNNITTNAAATTSWDTWGDEDNTRTSSSREKVSGDQRSSRVQAELGPCQNDHTAFAEPPARRIRNQGNQNTAGHKSGDREIWDAGSGDTQDASPWVADDNKGRTASPSTLGNDGGEQSRGWHKPEQPSPQNAIESDWGGDCKETPVAKMGPSVVTTGQQSHPGSSGRKNGNQSNRGHHRNKGSQDKRGSQKYIPILTNDGTANSARGESSPDRGGRVKRKAKKRDAQGATSRVKGKNTNDVGAAAEAEVPGAGTKTSWDQGRDAQPAISSWDKDKMTNDVGFKEFLAAAQASWNQHNAAIPEVIQDQQEGSGGSGWDSIPGWQPSKKKKKEPVW